MKNLDSIDLARTHSRKIARASLRISDTAEKHNEKLLEENSNSPGNAKLSKGVHEVTAKIDIAEAAILANINGVVGREIAAAIKNAGGNAHEQAIAVAIAAAGGDHKAIVNELKSARYLPLS